MPASHFNPMAYETSLEDAGVNRAQAAAHAQGLADLHADFMDLRSDFMEFRIEMHKEFASFRVEMHKEFATFKVEIIKWMVGMSILQTATTVTLIKLMT